MNVLTKPPAPSATTPATSTVARLPGATPMLANPTAPAPAPAPTTLAPASFAELVEFAAIAARSQFVPKDYRGHPEDILLAVQLGSEVGLRPLQALQNIAVINGRPAVWGDALPGLCKASAVFEDLIETFEREDDPDFLTAICVAKRHGSTPVTARFSVQDAKRAGLWGKPIWQTYPRRMLQMRARSFALRDTFPDVLKGLISVEEARDLPTPAERAADTVTIDAASEKPAAPSPPVPAAPAPIAPAEPAHVASGRTRRQTTRPARPATFIRWRRSRVSRRSGHPTNGSPAARRSCAPVRLPTPSISCRWPARRTRGTSPPSPASIPSRPPRSTPNSIVRSRRRRPHDQRRRRMARHRPNRTLPGPLSGATTPDEAAAILADLEGLQTLRHAQPAATGNLPHVGALLADHVQRNLLNPRMPDPAPRIGIFWAVADPHGQPHLLAYPCALTAAESYGDCLSCPAGHDQTWQAWRRGQPKSPLALLAPIIAQDEYEHWPRGRIVYEPSRGQFVIYADRQLLTSPWLAQIRAHFHLPAERTTARSDLHYRSGRAIGPP